MLFAFLLPIRAQIAANSAANLFHESPFFELDGEIYHKLLVTAHLKSGKRGAYLRANLDRAKLHKLRQFRYIRFLKTDWIKRLRMPILPYPKRQPD